MKFHANNVKYKYIITRSSHKITKNNNKS